MRLRLPPPENLVDRQQEGVIEHPRQQFLENWGGLLDAGIGIDFDEPGPALFVEHEVVAEDLEAVVALLPVELLPHAEGSDSDD